MRPLPLLRNAVHIPWEHRCILSSMDLKRLEERRETKEEKKGIIITKEEKKIEKQTE